VPELTVTAQKREHTSALVTILVLLGLLGRVAIRRLLCRWRVNMVVVLGVRHGC
jgi:hypothetical protein